uniref:Cnidarian restricted protein n=1 Tax=Clytia hemisphaerica TaxID=252671 RepID=A0A7M5XLQ6_9CNID
MYRSIPMAGLSTCFLCFIVCLPVSMAFRHTITTCFEVKTVSIIPNILEDPLTDSALHPLQDSTVQLRYLIKSMLHEPCFIVWAFSPVQNRLIRLYEENYTQFIDTQFQSVTQTDENDLLELLLNIRHHNDNNMQTLFFVFNVSPMRSYYNYFKMIQQAQNMYEKKQIDVVVWSLRNAIYKTFWNWLPKQNLVVDAIIGSPPFDPHLHRILMDLMLNPQYDWQKRYTRNANVTCRTSKRINLYFWAMDNGNRFPSNKIWNDVFENLSLNATFNRIYTYYNFIISSHKSHQPRDKFIKEMKEEEQKDDIIVIHLPITISQSYKGPPSSPMKFNKENTIHIYQTLTTLEDTPQLRNGSSMNYIMIQENDCFNPLFFELVIQQVNRVLCEMN